MLAQSKINASVNISDEAFNPADSLSCHFSAQVSSTAFAYAILHVAENKYVALKQYSLNVTDNHTIAEVLRDLAKNEEVFRRTYKSTQFSIINQRSTLVPKPFFSKENQVEYLAFNTKVNDGDSIHHDLLKNIDAYNIYSIPAELENVIRRNFPKATFIHYSSALIESLILGYKNVSDKLVFVNVRQGEFDVVVLNKRQLAFYNSFSYQATEDLVYFTLFIYEQLKLNPEKEELILLGDIEKNSAIFNLLYKYIRNISFAKRNDSFNYTYGFNYLPQHSHYSLLNQYMCS